MKNYFFTLYLLLFGLNLVLGQTFTDENWTKFYEVNENKIIGIWPHDRRYDSVERLKELRYKWGYNYALLAMNKGMLHYNMLIDAGFDSLKIVRQINQDNYVEVIESVPAMWAYYIDEPSDRGDNFYLWEMGKNWINDNYPNAKIIISGYKRNNTLKEYVDELSDNVMFSSYKHWWNILGIWVPAYPEDPDQRKDWKDMKDRFGDKFAFSWVGAHRDEKEYDDLLGKAENLYLDGVFLYQLQPHEAEVTDANLEKFSAAASNHNYLKTYFQQTRNYFQDGVLVDTKNLGFPYLSEIPTDYNHTILNFPDHAVTNNRLEDYFAEIRITAGGETNFIIPESKSAGFTSENEIILKPGFHAERGSNFKAYIEK